MRLLIILLGFALVTGRGVAQSSLQLGTGATAIPTDPAALGKVLCEAVDLNTPGLEEMRRQAAEGHYPEALAAWRDYKVDALRRADLGVFDWHGDQRHPRRLAAADFLIGKIDAAAYEKTNPPSGSFFIDRYGMRGFTDGSKPIDWLARDSSGDLSVDYANGYVSFSFAIPFATRYWEQGDPAYLRKFFRIGGDFAVRQRALVEALPAEKRQKIACGWTTRAQDALSQSDRVFTLIRIIGLFAKSLPDTAPKADWNQGLAPRDVPLRPGSSALIPTPELAEIALSLVNDHPQALKERYLNKGAVPNQRMAGLRALLTTAMLFPEFKASKPLLAEVNDGLADYFKGVFHRDGGMLEQSFNYNLGELSSYTELIAMLKPVTPNLAAGIERQQAASQRAIASLTTPIGGLPGISSYRSQNPPPIWKDDKARQSWLAGQSTLTGAMHDPLAAQVAGMLGGSGIAPSFTSIDLPFSGYYVQRGGWTWDAPYLFFQGSRPSRGHHTAGNNAVQVAAFGRPLLVYGGSPVYFPGQLPVELRSEFKAINGLLGEDSSWKANTVLIDDESQKYPKQILQEAPADPVDARWFTSRAFDYLEGFHDGVYGGTASGSGATHLRQVIFIRDPGLWVLVDTVNTTDGKPHEFCQNWIVPGDETNGQVHVYGFGKDQLSVNSAAHTVRTSDPEGPNLTMIHSGLNGGALHYIHHYGEKNPWRGWFSYGFGAFVPAHQIEVRFTATDSATLITVIHPRRTGETEEIAVSDLSPAGNLREAACRFTLPGNRTVTVHARKKLEFTVSGPSGSDGLIVTGRGVPGSYAFHHSPGGEEHTLPITSPAAFSWSELPGGITPRYTP